MARIKSAKKRAQLQEIQRKRNAAIKSKVRTAVKDFGTSLANGEDNSEAKMVQAVRTIDKAVTKGTLHPNTAARKKSQIMKAMNKAKAE
ncbi:MAG: 30S ribosomal protein S20 [Bacillota bacterium]